jgi:hypothetical protein
MSSSDNNRPSGAPGIVPVVFNTPTNPGTTSTPRNFDPINPGRFRPVIIPSPEHVNRAMIAQIRGQAANHPGFGIPFHVYGVSSTISPAASGATSAVTVAFSRNPGDAAYGGVKLFAKGYQGNQNLTQVGGGVESPITAILNNTGEPVSLFVQSTGNGGSAPIASAPSVGVNLPLAAAGGFGKTTNAPGVNKLIGDVTGTAAGTTIPTTLAAIDGTAVSAASPTSGTYLFYNGTAWVPYNPFLAAPSWHDSGEGGPYAWNPNGGAIGKFGGGIFFFMFKLAYTFTFKRCSFRAVTGGSGSQSAFGIYSADGTTKYISWDSIATTSTTNYSVTAGPVTLQPGLYMFAYASTGGTQAPNTDSGYSTSGSSDATEAWNLDGTYVRSGQAGNTLSSGAMPSALGSLATTTNIPPTICHVCFTPV